MNFGEALEQVKKNGCKHPEDSWTNYWCGECGDYMYSSGCRGARGKQMDARDTACVATIHHDENAALAENWEIVK